MRDNEKYLKERFERINSTLLIVYNMNKESGAFRTATEGTKNLLTDVLFDAAQIVNSDYLSEPEKAKFKNLYKNCLEIYCNMKTLTPMEMKMEDEMSRYSPKKLSAAYDIVCEIYAQRLCDQFEMNRADAYWVLDQPGTVFCFNGSEYSLNMEDIKLLVDECVDFKTFSEWWDYNLRVSYAQQNNIEEEYKDKFYNINLRSWLKGAPKSVSEDELKEQERIFWESIKDFEDSDSSF